MLVSTKTTVTVAVGTGSTAVATLSNCLGLHYIIVVARNAGNGNALTITTAPLYNSTNFVNTNLALTNFSAVAGAASVLPLGYLFGFDPGGTGQSNQIPVDTIKISASQVTAGSTVTFDIYQLAPSYSVSGQNSAFLPV